MKRKFCFNMVEIILAIAIIAIGISSVMGLFVAGMKSGQKSIVAAKLPDVSETVLAHVKSEILKNRTESGWGSIAAVAPETANETWGTVENDTLDKVGSSDLLAPGTTNKTLVAGTTPGFFLYRSYSAAKKESSVEYTPVHSAIARVRKVAAGKITVSNPHNQDVISDTDVRKMKNSAGDSDESGTISNAARLVLEVRISHPADSVPAQRESKTFVVELYNDKYHFSGSEGVKAQ